MEKTYKAENKHPELNMDELNLLMEENARKIKTLPTPKLMLEAADICESMAFRMLEQSEECKKASGILSKKFVDMFKNGGLK